jgi:ribosomal protein S6
MSAVYLLASIQAEPNLYRELQSALKLTGTVLLRTGKPGN